MSYEPDDLDEYQKAAREIDVELHERIAAGVAAGAARLPFPEPKPSTVRTYDPKDVTITFKGIEIKGYADGTFVEVARDEDGWTKHASKPVPANRSGTVNVTLMSTSENAAEMAIHANSHLWMGFDPGSTDESSTVWVRRGEDGKYYVEDLVIDDAGDLVPADGTSRLVDAVRHALMHQRGDWFLPEAIGVRCWKIDWARALKLARRRVIRARARARKRRRGWS